MSALFSDCRRYRWRLEREVQGEGLVVALVGVNPSTADATVDDQTIRKELGFAKRNGWRKIIKGNVFAYRATDVHELRAVPDHRHAENASHLAQIAAAADLIVPCWGARGKLPRALHPWLDSTMTLLRGSGKPIVVFGLTRSGDPLHPLTLGYGTALRPWPASDCVLQRS